MSALYHPCAGGCGRAIAGRYCTECRGDWQRRIAATAKLEQDRQVLTWVEVEGLQLTRVAARRGVSRVRAGQLLEGARRRERYRRDKGMELAIPAI